MWAIISDTQGSDFVQKRTIGFPKAFVKILGYAENLFLDF